MKRIVALGLCLFSLHALAQWTPTAQPVSLPKPPDPKVKIVVVQHVEMPKPYTRTITPVAITATK